MIFIDFDISIIFSFKDPIRAPIPVPTMAPVIPRGYALSSADIPSKVHSAHPKIQTVPVLSGSSPLINPAAPPTTRPVTAPIQVLLQILPFRRIIIFLISATSIVDKFEVLPDFAFITCIEFSLAVYKYPLITFD